MLAHSKLVHAQTLVAQSSIERLDELVFRRLTGRIKSSFTLRT